ncbi:MMPL family transporter [Nocardia sp. XZ_19_385]|uniref:MMPL family transporter n=1 Tax=Nocardia sp. XZ_19_385 TaxID=2769488 RepID=UPI0018906651|nr:MMPL family transporter [Nocardia sp. XZ_19_385]
MTRYRSRVFAGWLIAVVLGLFGLPHLLGSLVSPPFEVTGSQSQQAGAVLAAGLPSLGNEPMIAVFHSPSLRATDPAFRAAINAGMAALGQQDGISGVILLPVVGDPELSPVLDETLEPLRPLLHDEHTAYMLVGASGNDQERQDRAPAQQAAVDQASGAASAGAVRTYLVAASAFGQVLQEAEIADWLRIELVAVPAAIVVLLLGLRAPVAALVPMIIAGASIVTTLGLFALLAAAFPVDGMLLIGVNTIGLGIGIDYALFVTNRYREELAAGVDPEKALRTASATTGRTVVYSGLILFMASVSLFLVRWPIFAQFVVGIMAVTAVTLAASLSLLPAVLASLTKRLEWQPRLLSPRVPLADGATRNRQWLARWAEHLMRHPWPYAIAVTAGLLLTATPLPDMRLGIDLERRALADTSYMTGLELTEPDVPGLASAVTVLLERPADTGAPDLGPLLAALRTDPEVAAVTELDNGVDLTTVIVIPKHVPAALPAVELVHRIRTQIVPATAPNGLPVLVGGTNAVVADILTETSTKLWWVVACVLTLMFLMLVVILRSLLLPLKAILMNLLATGAAFGLTVLLFQNDSEGMIWPQVPLIVFVLLFGLSTDYELFLVRRIQEEYLRTGDNRAAVVTGLQRTARPLSLAAAILAVGFGSLLVSEINGLKELGFAIAAALIIDATVIRLILVPALMQIMGSWNWWLPVLDRRAPNARTERVAEPVPAA